MWHIARLGSLGWGATANDRLPAYEACAHRLGEAAVAGSRGSADGDRVPALFDHGRARQAVGPASRQLPDCLFPVLFWVCRDYPVRFSEERPLRVSHDEFLRPSFT